MSGTLRDWAAAPLLLLTAIAALAAWFVPAGWNWLAVVAVFAVFIAALGRISTGRTLGILINERKCMSLSRFQMVLWTVLIVSAYLVIAMARVKNRDVAEPLIVGVDWTIWTLLGMSTTSLLGTPLLNGTKTRKEPRDVANQPRVVERAAAALGERSNDVEANRAGLLYANTSIDDARFADMLEGEELANTQFIDVGKLQLFFFTAVVATVYGVQLFQLIGHNVLTDDVSLPALNQGLLGLLGVSHAGYLGSKGITSTPSSP